MFAALHFMVQDAYTRTAIQDIKNFYLTWPDIEKPENTVLIQLFSLVLAVNKHGFFILGTERFGNNGISRSSFSFDDFERLINKFRIG